MKNPDGSVDTETNYFEPGSDGLNEHGHAHFHLLLASELHLRKIKYMWKGMPTINWRKATRSVSSGSSEVEMTRSGTGREIRKRGLRGRPT